MAIRWEDFKERGQDLLNEFKRQKVGIAGLIIIVTLLMIGILAPVLAPDVIGHWEDASRWENNPRGVPPDWYNYFTSDDYAPSYIETQPSHYNVSNYIRNDRVTHYDWAVINYTYDFQHDVPPQNLVLHLDGTFDNTSMFRTLNVHVIRPDGEMVSFSPEARGGVIDRRMNLIRGNREQIYNWAYGLGVVEEDIPEERIHAQRTLFGKNDTEILSPNPNPLRGEYTIHITFLSEDIEFNFGEDEGRLVVQGATFGWMGTDNRGRDIALGWVWGARYALLLGAIIAGTTISLGTLYGMTSAYLGGWKDEFMQRINEIVIGIPILPILIIMMFIWRQSFWVMVALMSILYWRGIAKTIRARGLQIRQSTFVEAAQSLGAGTGRVITTHMIPQILPYSMAEGALLVPIVVITEASLSVLGLGDPRLVTWGKLLSQAQANQATVQGLWWWVLLPGLGITFLGFGFIATGMAIERIVNPKMRQR